MELRVIELQIIEHTSAEGINQYAAHVEEGASVALLAKTLWEGKVHIYTVNGSLSNSKTILKHGDVVDVYPLMMGA